MKKTVAVLIINYNGKKYLKECLDSVLRQTGVDFDAIVVDNVSTDDSIPYLKKNYPQVKLIINEENLGFSGGYNAGFKKIANDYQYSVLLSNDTKVYKNWLRELVRAAESQPGIGATCPIVIDKQGKMVDGAGGYFPSFITGTNAGLYVNKRPGEISQDPFFTFYGTGCSLLVNNKVCQKIGLFEEKYFAYFEEVDLCWRMQLAGYKILCNPKSLLYHKGSGTFEHNPYSIYLGERNRLLTYFKNLEAANLFLFLPTLIIFRLMLAFVLTHNMGKLSAKIKGVLVFLKEMPAYWSRRQEIQKLRKVSDSQVLSPNNLSLFSIFNLIKIYQEVKGG